MRSKWMSLTLMVVMAIASGSLLAACGGGGNDCGPGTVEEGGRCVPLCAENQYWDGTECKSVTTCANGTTLNPATGECEPACGEGQYWDGTACVDAPECGDGTVFNPDTGQCEPECGTDEYWDGTACVAVPECPGGYTFNPTTGECENDCPPGTFWDDVAGDCVDACGDGTVLHDGECVPWIDVVEADYPEAAENNDPSYGGTPGAFDVPAIDAEDATILGGVIGVPADLDGDEVEDVDIDCWLFAGTAEMRLEIDGWADGLFNVATFVQGVGEENSFYWRYGLNPDGAASERQVVLPLDGDYMICASDYSNFTGDFPVGGDDLGYFIAIRQLVNPAPTQSSLGSAVTGAVWDLDQYVVTGTAGELVDVVINDWNADNLGLITIKNASGDLIGQLINSFSFWGMVYEIPFDPGMKFTLAMPADGGMMMTMDYRYRTAGGNDYDVTVQYNPDVEPVTQIPADLNGEDLGSSAAEKIYQIDAEAGKLYYMLFENLGADVTASLIGVLRDANYNVISYVDTEYDPAPYELFFYAKEDTRFYIEVFDYYQEEGSDYTYDLSIDVYDVTDMGTLDENNTQATLAGEGPIAAAGDQFWYAITFAADGNVTGTFTPYNFDVAVEIFDEMVTPLAIEDYMLVGEAETFTYIMGAATFLFRVTESGMDEGDNGYTFDIDIQYEAFPAEAEPNDDMAHATPFVYDPADPWTIYSGHIDTASDLDWYAFTVTESGVLWAQTLAGTPYADTEIWIYDTDGTTVLANNDDYSYDHYFSYAEAELMAAGTYYIVVGCTSVADYCVPDVDYLLAAGFLAGECMIGNAYCADASTLMECQDGTGYVATTCDYGCDDSTGVAQCTPPPLDEVEPNDDFASAQTLAFPSVTTGYSAPSGDNDFYTFTLTADTTVSVFTYEMAGMESDTVDTRIYLYDSTQTQIAYDDDGGPGLYSAVVDQALTAGTYYVEIRPYTYSDGYYTLELAVTICTPGEAACNGDILETCNDFGTGVDQELCAYGCDDINLVCNPPDMNEVEPNNDAASADAVWLNYQGYGLIDPGDDIDYYAVTLTAQASLRIETSAIPGQSTVDTRLYLYAPDGTTELAYNDDYVGIYSTITETEAADLAAGTYYVAVDSYSTYTGYYTLTIQVFGSANLVLSEYIEGSSNDKAIEIYNAGTAAITLAECSWSNFNNGATTPSGTQGFDGDATGAVLNPGEVWTFCNATGNITGCSEYGDVFYNGDDAVVLYWNGIVVDSFGRVGEDPGSYWGIDPDTTQDHTLRRHCMAHGDWNPYDAFVPTIEYDIYANNDFTDLGVPPTCP